MKIRIGNDFVFNWAIERGGLPEDLASVLEKHLYLSVFGKRIELVEDVDYDITGNVIRIEVTPAIANIIGTYEAEFHYILPDTGLSDEERKCAVDVDAFQIVAKTAQADDSTEFSMTSDMAIAFKGDKGDSAYEVWLKDNPGKTKEDYFNWLQKPATDIAETVNLQEQARADAENTRKNNEEQRVEAELLRQTNTQEAITNAENATENANTAAQNADDARLAIEDDLALKANQTDLAQLADEVDLLDAVQGAKIKDIENVLSSANLGQSTQVSVSGASPLSLPKNAANSGMSVKLEGLTEDVGGVITHFEPTGRVRSVDKNGLNPTALYLTAPELRSNGTVKDEIRKGANGYELVKRVGVGTSNGEIVINGDFDTADNWTIIGDTSIISDGTLKIVADAGVQSHATQNKTITAGKIYRYSINVLGNTGLIYLYFGSNFVRNIRTADGIGVITGFFIPSSNATYIRLVKELGSATNAEIDNISIIEYNPAEGIAMAGGEAVFGSSVHYTLANPVVSPINYGGILNSAENGTVYHEPVIADAGVYDTKMDILLTDYPIATIEEIIKHENGIDMYLDVSTAVIASDGLSFTHPDLTDGDLVLFTYAYDKESTNGNITATFYDSNVVKIDTATGKAYKIEDVITNGVLTRTLTEV